MLEIILVACMLWVFERVILLITTKRRKDDKIHVQKDINVIMYVYSNIVMSLQLGLGENSLDHHRREEFPAIFL